MTDKELAEKYTKASVNEYKDSLVDIDDIDILKEAIAEAYIAGLKTGRKEKWHDLRKNPKDLPNGYRAVLNQEGKTTIYDPSRGFLGLDGVGVIAWCEIPKYPIVHSKENNDWHYIKDGDLPNVKFGRADVTVAYINAYENPCKMDCCFNGSNFVYWGDRKPIGWKKVDIFGKIYAWKYQEELPEPPKENEE